ncbi:hypothetical protein BLNAU_20104 [Blattamonas nauphoetae]|uniref:Uncharacterized protein n=1 Tax=Blattamonas nauphoetae TaxID=2049346 RepID=A0ABQ9WZM9_9EUKA|nr:hypothetical protein BLNAU_20104 [Blattamonas nauphoetae]
MRTELHICISSDDLETENGLDSSSANGDSLLAIFRIRNSTVSLTSFCLNSEEPSSLIASASSSCVTVSDSDIRSNGMNCPFVMLVGMVDGQSGDFGSSLDIRKCRHVSSSLLSLVPLAHISHKSDLAMNAGQQVLIFEETQFGEETTISASELAICNCRLTFGTGPLIGFGCDKDKTERGGEQAILPRKVSTLLAKSQIMNTTSHPSKRIVEDAGRMELTQRVTSSCVCSSTNHLYGTACVDMNANVMESLLSVNTSFLSCLTDTPTNLGQHFKTQQNTTESPAFFKLCTFKDCSAARGGGAIYLSGKGSLLVEECSFRKCRCDQYGGAIYFYPPIGFTFSAASSSFADCSSDYAVGSLNLISCLSSTLINCVFIDSTSQVCGGSVFLDKWDAASTSSSITNCLFENSRATTTYPEKPFSGGALYFSQAKSIQLNFVNFRGNEAGINPGNDIMSVSTAASLFTSETIVGCSSTSDSPRMRVYEEAEGTDDHLPNPTMIVIHVSCMATEIDVDKAEFTLKMSTAITGTVLVLIDNSDGTRTPTSDQAPNIGRVLAFSFDRSDSSSCCVSLGESNLVQEPLSDYHVVTSSFVGSFMLSASCVLDESERNSLITISGKNIPSGILSVTLSEDTVLNFEFQPKQTTSDVLKIHLSGDSPQLGFGKTYRIVSAESQTPPTQHIAMPFLIEIVIPDPPRLTTLHEPEYDSALKTVRLQLKR